MPTHHRFLNQKTFATLSIADKLRAYLLLRSTAVPTRTLEQVSGATSDGVYAHLSGDIKAGYVKKGRASGYALTNTGRKRLALRLPVGLLGVRVEGPP